MKFGLFYEHQLPQPWGEESELRLYQQALDQIELADRLGIDYVWEVEHHFLEEYSHSSAPEVFLAACSQRTRNIRLGHGITLMPPNTTTRRASPSASRRSIWYPMAASNGELANRQQRSRWAALASIPMKKGRCGRRRPSRPPTC